MDQNIKVYPLLWFLMVFCKQLFESKLKYFISNVVDLKIQQSYLTKNLIKYEFNFIECVRWSSLLLFIYECVRLTLLAVDVIVSPFTRPSTTLEFVNVLLLIIVFHAFHNKQKKNNKMIAVVFYMYIFLIGLVLVFFI